MALTLEQFFCCLDLQLGGILMGWWGMIISAISIVLLIAGLLFGEQYYNSFLHVNTGGAIGSVIISCIVLLIYFYFSYQLLLGTQGGNSSQMVGYLIIHGIFVVLFVLAAFKNAASLVLAGLYVYLWICIYSLYVKTGGNAIV